MRRTETWGNLRFVITLIWRWCSWSTRFITTASSRSIPNSSGRQQKQVWDGLGALKSSSKPRLVKHHKPFLFLKYISFFVKVKADWQKALQWRSKSDLYKKKQLYFPVFIMDFSNYSHILRGLNVISVSVTGVLSRLWSLFPKSSNAHQHQLEIQPRR